MLSSVNQSLIVYYYYFNNFNASFMIQPMFSFNPSANGKCLSFEYDESDRSEQVAKTLTFRYHHRINLILFVMLLMTKHFKFS